MAGHTKKPGTKGINRRMEIDEGREHLKTGREKSALRFLLNYVESLDGDYTIKELVDETPPTSRANINWLIREKYLEVSNDDNVLHLTEKGADHVRDN